MEDGIYLLGKDGGGGEAGMGKRKGGDEKVKLYGAGGYVMNE